MIEIILIIIGTVISILGPFFYALWLISKRNRPTTTTLTTNPTVAPQTAATPPAEAPASAGTKKSYWGWWIGIALVIFAIFIFHPETPTGTFLLPSSKAIPVIDDKEEFFTLPASREWVKVELKRGFQWYEIRAQAPNEGKSFQVSPDWRGEKKVYTFNNGNREAAPNLPALGHIMLRSLALGEELVVKVRSW